MSRLPIVVLTLLVASAGALADPADLGTQAQREAGKVLYDKYCSQCHGDTGAGDGYATARVKPAPRDFTAGKYKLRTTPSGKLPTDEDIKRSIRNGLPYTSMPPWPQFSDAQLQNLTYYLKTFSGDFTNPDKAAAPIDIPSPPSIDAESIERGRVVYENLGCLQCHGELGRGDGPSAPTMKDDWGDHLRPADMTMRWTFRGGPTRQDIFRTFSTGLNGTPMPSYYDSIEENDRWDLVNYIYSLGEGDEPDYDELLIVPFVRRELELDAEGDPFEGAPTARFPLIGQIFEPGRNFYPSATSLRVQAVYNGREIAFRVRWNDMRAETSGRNGPDLQVPPWDAQDHHDRVTGGPAKEDADSGDDFWGEAADDGGSGDDFWGEAADEGGDDDFWGQEEEEAVASGPDNEFSDAVALQFPKSLPSGIRKPYFNLGDAQNPVDLWFVDLARETLEQYVGRGSALLERSDGDLIDVAVAYDRGEWTVTFRRDMRSSGAVSFESDQYVPIAFSVWDGFNRERGNKRALSAWFHLYLEPSEKASAVGPMLRSGLIVLFLEILVIVVIRRRFAGRKIEDTGGEAVSALG